MENCVIYSLELEQLVCTACKVAILPEGLSEHLRKGKAHQNLSPQQRKQWVDTYSIANTSHPKEAARQEDGREEIVELTVLEGYQCNECEKRSPSNKAARKHNISVHQSKGLPSQA